MQSNIVSWLCMRQHLPVIPLKLDGSTAVQGGKLSKSQWAQERRAPNLAQTECERSKWHGAKRGKHQILKIQKGTRSDSCAPRNGSTRSSCIVLHKHPRSGSSLWIIPPGYLNANHCPSLEACWSIPVQKQFKSILIVHTTWFLCEDPIHSKEVEMGLQAFTRVCTNTFLISLHQLDILLLLCFPPHCHLLHIFSSTSKTWFTVYGKL
jgi:hypothetical protein